MQTILSKIDELLFILEALKESSTTDEKAFQRLERLYIKGDISSEAFSVVRTLFGKEDKETTHSYDARTFFVPGDSKRELTGAEISVEGSDGCHNYTIASLQADSVKKVFNGFLVSFESSPKKR